MSGVKWLSRAMVEAIHDEALVAFGGAPGLRDASLLESALARPRQLLAYGADPSLFDLAATLCSGIARNHPFVDGNKRTALLAARAFLFLNGQIFEPAQVEEVSMMLDVAEGKVDEHTLSHWLQANCR